jgi:hypothetical protein
VITDADIRQLLLLRQHQHMAHARPMHFDAQVVAIGIRRRQARKVFTVAEADLQYAWRVAAEQRGQVERRGGILHSITGPEIFQRAGLPHGHASGAHHEAADGSVMFGFVHSVSDT